MWSGELEKITDYKYRIPKSYKKGMRVDGIIYTNQKLLESIKKDDAPEQVVNVAHLPGIVKYSLAMPDVHWGYGAPIGGVSAFDIEEGIIAPGMIGYDINCGVRLIRTDLTLEDIKDKISKVVNTLYEMVPSGVGSKGEIKISHQEEKKLLVKGAKWAVEKGMGVGEDIECCEEYGAIEGAEPECVSERALERGKQQAGTLGSGNHFLEVQVVDEVFDKEVAEKLGISVGKITVMIHSGSRGFGYQICDDYIRVMVRCLSKYKIEVPDRQLACAPLSSPEAKQYIGAMKAAANYAWANRQVLMHLTRKGFEKVFSKSWQSLGMNLVYDVAHNIAKFEKHVVNNKEKVLCVHRKGATRAFGPNNPELPARYREIGQPVIIPGDMGTASYLLVGTEKSAESFFSTCHGAGRVKSRHEAIRTIDFNKLMKELSSCGIEVRAAGKKTVVEEAPSAYKDIDDVVDVVDKAGLSKKVCRMKPLCVVKG